MYDMDWKKKNRTPLFELLMIAFEAKYLTIVYPLVIRPWRRCHA